MPLLLLLLLFLPGVVFLRVFLPATAAAAAADVDEVEGEDGVTVVNDFGVSFEAVVAVAEVMSILVVVVVVVAVVVVVVAGLQTYIMHSPVIIAFGIASRRILVIIPTLPSWSSEEEDDDDEKRVVVAE